MSDPIGTVLAQVRHNLERNPDSDVHTVYRGYKEVGGRTLLNDALEPVECVVCVVERKRPVGDLAAQRTPHVGRIYNVGDCQVPTDVVEAPRPAVLRLPVDEMTAQAINDLQRCHPSPIPGGVQIAPQGARWVGTLGSAIAFPEASGEMLFGALTNNHVAHGGRFLVGTRMLQPGPGPDWFGTLHSYSRINFSGGANRVDAALLNCRRVDGRYAPLTHTVEPVQFGLGPLNPEPRLTAALGDRVVKVGRTTGLTRGRIVGLDATTTVDYGSEGTARFEQQYVIRADQTSFSEAGDSGSLILHELTLSPLALLFAGGGRNTIANPIGFVLDWCRGRFFLG